MKKNLQSNSVTGLLICLSVFIFNFSDAREWVSLKGSNDKADVILVSSSASETVLKMTLNGFSKTAVTTPQGNSYVISSPGTTPILQAGAPDISRITASVIIPDEAQMNTEVIASAYTDYTGIDVAPSRGSFARNVDPASIPYIYGEAYSNNNFYPGNLTSLRNPFILRDYRGQTVLFYPFQYNPVTKTLRVYSEVTVRVYAEKQGGINPLHRAASPAKIDREFADIYTGIFKNGGNVINYVPLEEAGSMLIIAYGPYMPAMQPFVEWKTRRGIKVEMVDVATIGNTASSIQSYILNYYNSHNLKYVLIVGDAQYVATPQMSGGASDPSYGFLAGADSYAEVIVGRISAESISDVDMQVQKAVAYEKNPNTTAAWYHKGVCIGSNQGAGAGLNGLADWEFMRTLIRATEMSYYYTDVDELYDGTHGGMDATGDPTSADLINSINNGRSVIAYCGHGSQTSCGTTGFSTSSVSSLTNYDAFPFFWSVACVNGDFDNGTCLAEGLLRAHDGTQAKGCVATLMSSINQYWVEPMGGEYEMVNILAESYAGNIKRTFGGISVNGCMKMNDDYGSTGYDMTNTWHCFGDPSLEVRTNTPVAMVVSHDPLEYVGVSQFLINCNLEGALACVSMNGEILGTGIVSGGVVNVSFTNAIMNADTFQVTVTAYNCQPYMADVPVLAATGIANVTNATGLNIYPNPAKDIATINFSLNNTADVSLKIFNEAGQEIATVVNARQMPAGTHTASFNTTGISQGDYTCRIITGNAVYNQKFTIVK